MCNELNLNLSQPETKRRTLVTSTRYNEARKQTDINKACDLYEHQNYYSTEPIS